MSKSDLTAEGIDTTTEAVAVTVVSWSDDKKTWESLGTVPTYRDSAGAAVTPTSNLSNVASVDFTTSDASHFSAYALSAATSGAAPATPTGLAVTQTSGAVTASLTWTANTEADLSGYFVYRDTSSSGSFPLRATLGAVSSYTDNVTAGTTYYYKISAFNTASHESAATTAVSLAVTNATGAVSGTTGGGGSPTIGQTTPTPSSASTGAATPAASTAAKTTTPTLPTPSGVGTPTTSVGAGLATATSRVTSPVALQVLKNIAAGSRGTDVRNLQEMLKSDSSVYPEGIVNGNFGPATLRAVKKFQQKYGIKPVNGRVGPLTRAKLQEVFGTTVCEYPAPPSGCAYVRGPNLNVNTQCGLVLSCSAPTPSSAGVIGGSASVFVRDLTLGNRNEDVRRLQQLLATDPAIYPEGIVNGNFGGLTQRAIKRFQAKYGITQNGRVGPATRAKLQEVFGGASSTSPTPSQAATEQSLKDQIAETLKRIAALQTATSTAATTTPSVTATSTATTTSSTSVTATSTSSTGSSQASSGQATSSTTATTTVTTTVTATSTATTTAGQ